MKGELKPALINLPPSARTVIPETPEMLLEVTNEIEACTERRMLQRLNNLRSRCTSTTIMCLGIINENRDDSADTLKVDRTETPVFGTSRTQHDDRIAEAELGMDHGSVRPGNDQASLEIENAVQPFDG